MADKIKVLIVDDMMSIRLLLQSIFSQTPDIEVIGMAENPLEAREILKTKTPDVITLDVEMPEMDGITFLGKLMKLKPTPTIMISTLTHKGTTTAVKALELGAVDVIGKPSQKAEEIEPYREEILSKVRAAACARVGQNNVREAPSQMALNSLDVSPTLLIDDVFPKRQKVDNVGDKPMIAIGSSTGGPTALREILPHMPANCPPIVIVQHMSAQFTDALAKGIDLTSTIKVEEAKDGTTLKTGHAYIAPGGKHIAVKTLASGDYIIETYDLDKVNRHKPSVDILFRSVAQNVQGKATGVILTGMGDDGARCLKEMKEAGARTIAQDEASCIVYGMPRAAMKIEPSHEVKSLNQIINTLKEMQA